MALAWDDLDGLDDEDLWWASLAAEPPAGSWPGILERAAAARPRWQARAACSGLGPHRFYSTDQAAMETARAVCAGCPVSGPCGQLAADRSERFGIWAGLDRDARRQRARAG